MIRLQFKIANYNANWANKKEAISPECSADSLVLPILWALYRKEAVLCLSVSKG